MNSLLTIHCSVPSEQAFSVAGDIVTKKRNRMTANTIRLAMLTKAWLGLPEVESWEAVGENLGEDGVYEGDLEDTIEATEDVGDIG